MTTSDKGIDECTYVELKALINATSMENIGDICLTHASFEC